jgi:hypothetical protein
VLRVAGVYPKLTEINAHLCAVVAGVVAEAVEAEAASEVAALRGKWQATETAFLSARNGADKAAAEQRLRQATSELEAAEARATPLPPVQLTVFLNGQVAPFTVTAHARHAPQLLRFRLEAPEDAQVEGAKFWRELLRGVGDSDDSFGARPLTLGLSRAATATSIPDASSPEPFTLRVFTFWALLFGAMSLVLFAFSFALLARRTTLIRDNDLTAGARREALAEEDRNARTAAAAARAMCDTLAQDPNRSADATRQATGALKSAEAAADAASKALGNWDKRAVTANMPVGPYSLGRTQMAFWSFLVIAGFLFIALSLGQYLNLVTAETLVLLGISGATGLVSIQITGDKARGRVSRGFIQDILANEAGELQLQRVQSVAWTLVLGAIFIWIAFRDFRFAVFDTNLLLLMGIAQSLYLGFKFREEPP